MSEEQGISKLYALVTRLRAEVAEYISIGMNEQAALATVRKETCASSKAWQLVENEISCSVCGSLVDVSKKGKLYCIDICWKNPDYVMEREQESNERDAFYESYHGDWGDR